MVTFQIAVMNKNSEASEAPPSYDSATGSSTPYAPLPMYTATADPPSYRDGFYDHNKKAQEPPPETPLAPSVHWADQAPTVNTWAYEMFYCFGDIPTCLLQSCLPCVNEVCQLNTPTFFCIFPSVCQQFTQLFTSGAFSKLCFLNIAPEFYSILKIWESKRCAMA